MKAKLTEAQRQMLRAPTLERGQLQALAREFGISKTYAWKVRASLDRNCGSPRGRYLRCRPSARTGEVKALGKGRSPYCPTCRVHFEFHFDVIIGQTQEVCHCGSRMITPEVQRLRWKEPAADRERSLAR